MKDLMTIITNPGKVFEEERKPWIPIIFTIIISILGFLVLRLALSQEFAEKTRQLIENLPEDQRERALAGLTNTTRMLLVGTITILIVTPIKILLQSLIFNQAAPVFGGELSFLNSMTILSYANFVSSLSLLIKVPLAIITRQPLVRTDLGILFNEIKGYLPVVLSQVDIFTIWSLFIIAIGLNKYAKLDKNKSFLLVFILWGVYILGIAPLLAIRRV
ncbi:MAG: YIP1 family protein [Candidatus Hydrothermia bacterium]